MLNHHEVMTSRVVNKKLRFFTYDRLLMGRNQHFYQNCAKNLALQSEDG